MVISERRDGNGLAVFDRDHGEVAAVGMAHFAGADVLRFDADADFPSRFGLCS